MVQDYDANERGLLFTDYAEHVHIGIKCQIEERLSQPFLIQCTILSKNFDPKKQLGQTISLSWCQYVGDHQQERRSFHGHIASITQIDRENTFDGLSKYEITARPWLWLLKFSQKNRIFQQKTLSDILKYIFNEAGFSSQYNQKNIPTVKRPYTVQYNETDFDFVQRLLSEQGINYFFKHEKGSHTLCFQQGDKPFVKCDVTQMGLASYTKGKMPPLSSWHSDWSIHGHALSLSSYDYSKGLVGKKQKVSSHTIAHTSKLKTDRYPADTVDGKFSDLKSDVVNTEMIRMESGYHHIEAESGEDGLTLATSFALAAHPDEKQHGDYAITAITHTVKASEKSARYTNQFEAIPAKEHFLPPHYPKPLIYGLQSALVAGKKLGKREHDDQGRIKVKFHWDTEGGDNPSCYIRVAQGMTGKGCGMQSIPRVGEEVLVSFINNDPDQPIVVGAVYNDANKPPYAEANSTKTGIKTQPVATSNEWYFDDKDDAEKMFLHAAKDMIVGVENDQISTVKGLLKKDVTKSIAIDTKDDYNLTVAKTLSENAKTIMLEAEESITLKVGDNSICITEDEISIQATEINVSAEETVNISCEDLKCASKSDMTMKIGGDHICKAKGNAVLEGAKGIKIDSKAKIQLLGSTAVEIKSPAKISLSASTMIEAKGGVVKLN